MFGVSQPPESSEAPGPAGAVGFGNKAGTTWMRTSVAEKLDPRENPTLYAAVASDTAAAIARCVTMLFQQEIARYQQER
jgi:hypothetical protein